jgi:stress response protein YsnF
MEERGKERSLDWKETIGKQARGNGDVDLGEVKDVGQQYIMTRKGGLIDRETFYFPKYLVASYDGAVLRFNVSADQLERFTKEQPPVQESYEKYRRPPETMPAGAEAVIPVVGEKLEVSKTTETDEAIIVKVPVTEYRLIEVPVMHEEIKIIRRSKPAAAIASSPPPASQGAPAAAAAALEQETASAGSGGGGEPIATLDSPDQEVRVLLRREEVRVTKKPYVFEEVIVRKEKVAGTKAVSAVVTKERVDVAAAAAAPAAGKGKGEAAATA